MIVTKNELICILNELFLMHNNIKVKYGQMGPLFTIEFGENCIIKPISEFSYNDQRKRFLGTKNIDSLEKEVPKDSDFRDCFYAAGLLEYKSRIELEDKIIVGGKKTNILNKNRPLFIGYDTDALRFRLNRLVESIISKHSANSIMQIGFCISENVRSELNHRWSPKYKSHEVPIPRLPFTQHFLNQQPKDARMARLGAIEEKHITEFPQYIAAEAGRKYKDSDSLIIESYENFAKKHDVDMLLITGDADFCSKAEATRTLNAHRMEHPLAIGRLAEYHVEWDMVAELIFCTAIIFGYVEMEHIEVYGVWTGKEPIDWDSYSLKIEVNDLKMEERIKRHLDIIH